MRIQSISQNNYQKRNIGFESARVKVNIPRVKEFGEMHDDIISIACAKAFERVKETISQYGGKLVQVKGTELDIFIIDKATHPSLGRVIDLLNEIPDHDVAYSLSKNLTAGLHGLIAETQPTEMVLIKADVEFALEELYSSNAEPDIFYQIDSLGVL